MASTLPSFDEILLNVIQEYRNIFQEEPEIASCAPGRVNLIGEHVDYNDGYVFPMALPLVTIIVGKPNGTKECEIVTCCEGSDLPRRVKFETANLTPGLPKWVNYMKGVIHNFKAPVPGFNAVVITNVPIGGGLSSSAALEVSTITFLEALTGQKYEKGSDKALVCQKAEHDFADMPCGIMDQLISVMGKANHALLIDCQTLITTQIPFEAKDLAILICNSNVKHELSSSEYPTRRKQCNHALKVMGLKSYREATIGSLRALEKEADNVYFRRARHVITEIQRTVDAAEALKKGSFEMFGELMKQSHVSLRDDFEVSCQELDFLVETANKCSGVLGSRMTGGGFGGCTVTLVFKNQIENVIETMEKTYKDKTGTKADFYVCEPSEGTRVIDLKTLPLYRGISKF